jgi:predicted transcriptional regulator
MPIYEALLAQDGIELPLASTRVHLLERLTVANAMTSAVCCLRPEQTLAAATAELQDKSFTIAPIVNEHRVVIGAVSLAELRRAAQLDPDASVKELSKPVDSIRANEPLLEAVIAMTERSVRQLCVVSETQEKALVGIVAMSDVVQVHVRMAEPAKPRAPVKLATEVRVANVLREAVVVDGATKLTELDSTRSCIVRMDDVYGALLAEDVVRLVRDENLSMLTAADVAQAVPVVPSRATLDELVRALHGADANALIIQDAAAQDPLGIVSRNDLASALLDWYAVATSASKGSPGSSISRKISAAARTIAAQKS